MESVLQSSVSAMRYHKANPQFSLTGPSNRMCPLGHVLQRGRCPAPAVPPTIIVFVFIINLYVIEHGKCCPLPEQVNRSINVTLFSFLTLCRWVSSEGRIPMIAAPNNHGAMTLPWRSPWRGLGSGRCGACDRRNCRRDYPAKSFTEVSRNPVIHAVMDDCLHIHSAAARALYQSQYNSMQYVEAGPWRAHIHCIFNKHLVTMNK